MRKVQPSRVLAAVSLASSLLILVGCNAGDLSAALASGRCDAAGRCAPGYACDVQSWQCKPGGQVSTSGGSASSGASSTGGNTLAATNGGASTVVNSSSLAGAGGIGSGGTSSTEGSFGGDTSVTTTLAGGGGTAGFTALTSGGADGGATGVNNSGGVTSASSGGFAGAMSLQSGGGPPATGGATDISTSGSSAGAGGYSSTSGTAGSSGGLPPSGGASATGGTSSVQSSVCAQDGGCTCGDGLTRCGNDCVSLTSPQYCGTCSNRCNVASSTLACDLTQGTACSCAGDDSKCSTTSATGICLAASGICQCNGTECARGEICRPDKKGVSSCSCDDSATTCRNTQTCCQGTGCVDLSNSDANCGQCGHACPAGFSCNAGECHCINSQACDAGGGGDCTATRFCKCSGITCDAGQRCVAAGKCG